MHPWDQVDINKLNLFLDLGDKDRVRNNILDEYFAYLQSYMHLSDPETWAEAKYLFMVLKGYVTS